MSKKVAKSLTMIYRLPQWHIDYEKLNITGIIWIKQDLIRPCRQRKRWRQWEILSLFLGCFPLVPMLPFEGSYSCLRGVKMKCIVITN